MSNNQNTQTPPKMKGHGPMGGPGGGHGPAEKAKDVKGTTKKLAQRLSRYKIAIIIVMIFAIGSTIFSIVGPKILGNATTEIYTGLMNKINRTGGRLCKNRPNNFICIRAICCKCIILNDTKLYYGRSSTKGNIQN